MEIWKDIVSYDGYQVSSLGNVKSFKRYPEGKILAPQVSHKGYLLVALFKDGKHKTLSVARLVAQSFVPNPDGLPQVNHIDGNKLNNCVENLEWVTNAENMQHAVASGLIKLGEDRSSAKLTNEQVVFIRENPDGLTNYQLADMFGVAQPIISYIQRGLSYKNAGGTIRKSKHRSLTEEEQALIRKLYVKGSREFGIVALAKLFKCRTTTIRRIINESSQA